jgi:hypothetical protein
LTRGAIASPLYEPNRTKKNDEAARKQNNKCKSIVVISVTIGLVDFKNKGRQVIWLGMGRGIAHKICEGIFGSAHFVFEL